MFTFNEMKVSEELSFDFRDQFKECDVKGVDEDDNDENWSEETYAGVCSQRSKDIDIQYKQRTVTL